MSECPTCGSQHLKAKRREGARLSEPELELIGYVERSTAPPSNGDGWRSIGPSDLTEVGAGSFLDARGIRWLLRLGGDRRELSA